MVGMSGKSNEPRRGASSLHKKAIPAAKMQPSAEALHVAKILGDKYPPNLSDLISQVASVVPSCSEEEIFLALHDHDYEPHKAISALLDSDSQEGIQTEWTTTGRKGRRSRGGEGAADQVMAAADKLTGRPSNRGSGKGTSHPTREGVQGGGPGGSERGRGKGRASSAGRGRSASGGRREERTGKTRTRPPRGPARGRPRASPTATAPPEPSSVEEGLVLVATPTELWEDPEPLPSTEWGDQEQSRWDGERRETVFPDAIPFPTSAAPPASSAQPTSSSNTSPPRPRDPSPISFPAPEPPPLFVSSSSSSSTPSSSRHRSRHKRLARSQIPSQPVEMPVGTNPEIGELGIAFVGLDLHSHSRTTPVTDVSVEHAPTLPKDGSQAGLASETPSTTSTTSTTSSLLPSYPTKYPEEIGSSTTTATYTSHSGGGGGGGTKLEAPPGLPHPATGHTMTAGHSTAGLSTAGQITTGHTTAGHTMTTGHTTIGHTIEGHTMTATTGQNTAGHTITAGHSAESGLPHSVAGQLPFPVAVSGGLALAESSQPSSVESTGPLLPPQPISLPSTTTSLSPLPHSIELPLPTTAASAPTRTTAAGSTQLMPQASVNNGSSELLSAGPHAPHAPQGSAATTALHKYPLPQHGSSQPGKHPPVQPQQQPLVYPYNVMLQPPVMMPMSAYYDPEMTRYQASVSMAYYQHPTTSDPSIVSGITREHSSSAFGSEGGKYAAGSGDILTNTTPSNLSQAQQGLQQSQQMGHHPFMNPYYGGNVIYPMYHGYGVPGFSTPSMGPKPSAGSSYPGASGYQGPIGLGYEELGGELGKMYGMSNHLPKAGSLPSTSADMTTAASYKHQSFDSKTGSSYSGYNVQGGYSFMPTGPMPVQMPYLPAHDGSQVRGQKSKSYGSSQMWPGSHHSS